ncbi:hypothetical protein [Celerinatantimonas sp. MCCC 1A17872]|uniref:hypothetical protein n=1 Tax=Celerinatantimonas sp. MCCC 1A17872 TaxID=3177514 RepID=UPI0038C3CF9B
MASVNAQLMGFIAKNIECSFFERIREQIYIRYGIAENFLTEQITHTPKGRLRPQMLRYLTDEVLAEVGGEVRQTRPLGEHYLVSEHENIVISHVAVKANGRVRAAAHRKLLAMGNTILEPYTPDMFRDDNEDIRGKLHVVIIVSQPESQAAQQGVPQGIFIAVPFSDWSGYHAWLSIDEMIEQYQSEDVQEADTAWPVLKIALQEQEHKQGNGE